MSDHEADALFRQVEAAGPAGKRGPRIGPALAGLRRLNLSLTEIADRTGFARSTVHRWSEPYMQQADDDEGEQAG